MWKQPPSPLLEAINGFLTEEMQEWEGRAAELLKQLPDMQLSANVLSRRLNVLEQAERANKRSKRAFEMSR